MELSINSRLLCFGDSWTAGHGIETDTRWEMDASPPQFIVKLREGNSWPRWLSNKYDIPFVNMGGCGWGNEWIYGSIKECIDNEMFSKDDLIIVSFSYPYRYHDKNKYGPVEILFKLYEILKPYNHYFFNAFYPLLKDEDFDMSMIPHTFINPEYTYSDVLIKHEKKTREFVWQQNKRKVWTDNRFSEGHYHPNLNGYKILSEYIYSEILNHNNVKNKITTEYTYSEIIKHINVKNKII